AEMTRLRCAGLQECVKPQHSGTLFTLNYSLHREPTRRPGPLTPPPPGKRRADVKSM
ncbi:uncharacterized, partial [Tachysurus ichikawai]